MNDSRHGRPPAHDADAAAKPVDTRADDTWRLLAAFAQLHGRQVDIAVLSHHFGMDGASPGLDRVVAVFADLGVDVQPRRGGVRRLAARPGAVLGADRAGRLFIAAALPDRRIQVQAAGQAAPEVLSSDAFEDLWSGEWLEVQAGAVQAAGGDAATPFGFGWFWRSLRKHRGLLGEVLLASLFVQVFALVTPLIFQVVIDKVLTHRSMTTLDVMVVALLGVAVFEVVLGAMRHYLFSYTTNRIDLELGQRLFRHLMRLPLSYFESRRGGDTVARMRELENARAFMTGQALTSWLDLLFAVVFLAVMFQYSPLLTGVVVAALPVFFGASWLMTPMLRSKLEDRFALGAENQTFLVETVTAMETLKSHAVEVRWQREWENRLGGYVRAAFEAGHLGQAASQFTQLASKVLTAVLLYVGARQVIAGELSVGGLIAFNMLAGRVNAPILKLASLWQEFTAMKVSVKRLADIMDTVAEPAFRPGRSVPPAVEGRITFERVSFRYAPGAREVLADLSLAIRPGEVVGITGLSGAGKTTLMRLVQRLYTPERGRVLIDGMDLNLLDTAWLRRQLGVVGQDTVLFNRSVRENIALGRPDLSMAQVMHAARLAGAHEFIVQMPDGYDSVVGERGSKLSGGQRARVAIARALAGDPRILLLDEATASLDYESERLVHDNLAAIRKGRTVLIVAHRLSTLRMADRVLVMGSGRLLESGSHAELMDLQGTYRSLYEAHRVLEAA
ncbi:type I secretion system permease/ATPase [Xylophilus sp. Kf1]|nr:type I secretion system permease/ATPase [Xylophilus sp. Kf1]